MDNRRWVIALDKNTGRRMEFAMCDLNNVAFYQAKYTLNGYDVKVLTADEVGKFDIDKLDYLNRINVKVYDGDESGQLLFDGNGLEYLGWKNWE